MKRSPGPRLTSSVWRAFCDVQGSTFCLRSPCATLAGRRWHGAALETARGSICPTVARSPVHSHCRGGPCHRNLGEETCLVELDAKQARAATRGRFRRVRRRALTRSLPNAFRRVVPQISETALANLEAAVNAAIRQNLPYLKHVYSRDAYIKQLAALNTAAPAPHAWPFCDRLRVHALCVLGRSRTGSRTRASRTRWTVRGERPGEGNGAECGVRARPGEGRRSLRRGECRASSVEDSRLRARPSMWDSAYAARRAGLGIRGPSCGTRHTRPVMRSSAYAACGGSTRPSLIARIVVSVVAWGIAGADASSPLRIVEIAGLDSCTCCGTHVGASAELQAVKLLGCSPVRGRTRVHFVFGDRVLRLTGSLLAVEAKLTALLSCGRADHPEVSAPQTGQGRALCSPPHHLAGLPGALGGLGRRGAG